MSLVILIYAASHGPACLLFNFGVLPFEWLDLLWRPACYGAEWNADGVRRTSVDVFLMLMELLCR